MSEPAGPQQAVSPATLAAGGISRSRLAELINRERETYHQAHPRSAAAHAAAAANLLGGVPMTWMRMWPGGFPLYLATAHGARVRFPCPEAESLASSWWASSAAVLQRPGAPP